MSVVKINGVETTLELVIPASSVYCTYRFEGGLDGGAENRDILLFEILKELRELNARKPRTGGPL